MKPKQWVPWIIRLGSVALVSVLTGQITLANANQNDLTHQQTASNETRGNSNRNPEQGFQPRSDRHNQVQDGKSGTDGFLNGDEGFSDNDQDTSQGGNGEETSRGSFGNNGGFVNPNGGGRSNFGSNSGGFTSPRRGGGNHSRTHGS